MARVLETSVAFQFVRRAAAGSGAADDCLLYTSPSPRD